MGVRMTDFDLIIANVAEELENSNECVAQACKKTLMDYQSLETIKDYDGPALRMIAWDRS